VVSTSDSKKKTSLLILKPSNRFSSSPKNSNQPFLPSGHLQMATSATIGDRREKCRIYQNGLDEDDNDTGTYVEHTQKYCH
jgi:hypothetical protein